MPTEPEEINENINPFAGIDVTSDVGSSGSDSDDGGDDDRTNNGDDDCSGTAGSGCDAVVGNTLVHDIFLDSVACSEDEGIDFEDTSSEGEGSGAQEEEFEAGSSKEGDAELADPNFGFGIDLGIVPPWPTHGAGDQRPPLYTAGCVWTEEDWSCPYDAAFMVFWTLYEQSPASWRTDWAQRAPDWNTPLSNNFDHLIILADTSVDIQDHTKWFSRYRDRFRDQLSRMNPRAFPRRGKSSASVSRILEIISGQASGPYLEQHLICTSCRTLSQTERDIWPLVIGYKGKNKNPVWLHAVWTELIRNLERTAARPRVTCSHCHSPNEVQELKMPDVPWIWFERGEYSPIWPSLALTFDSRPQRLDYSLRAIIYAGGNHFTVRFRNQSGVWWKHDGREASGVPQPEHIQSEAGLLMNGTRFACMLIYCRDGY